MSLHIKVKIDGHAKRCMYQFDPKLGYNIPIIDDMTTFRRPPYYFTAMKKSKASKVS